jgi:hypothetical protein
MEDDIFYMYRLMNPGIKGNPKQIWSHWSTIGRYHNRSLHFDYNRFITEQAPHMDSIFFQKSFSLNNSWPLANVSCAHSWPLANVSCADKANLYLKYPNLAKQYCHKIHYTEHSNNMIVQKYKEFMFDGNYYLNKYKDIQHLPDFHQAYRHYIHIGMMQHRKITDFIWIDYLFLNPSLFDIGITTAEEAVKHWINYGKNEGRKYN